MNIFWTNEWTVVAVVVEVVLHSCSHLVQNYTTHYLLYLTESGGSKIILYQSSDWNLFEADGGIEADSKSIYCCILVAGADGGGI